MPLLADVLVTPGSEGREVDWPDPCALKRRRPGALQCDGRSLVVIRGWLWFYPHPHAAISRSPVAASLPWLAVFTVGAGGVRSTESHPKPNDDRCLPADGTSDGAGLCALFRCGRCSTSHVFAWEELSMLATITRQRRVCLRCPRVAGMGGATNCAPGQQLREWLRCIGGLRIRRRWRSPDRAARRQQSPWRSCGAACWKPTSAQARPRATTPRASGQSLGTALPAGGGRGRRAGVLRARFAARVGVRVPVPRAASACALVQ